MSSFMNPGLGGGRVGYTDTINVSGAHHTKSTALQYVAFELYGNKAVLSGSGLWKRFRPDGKQSPDGYAREISEGRGVVGRWDADERYLVILTDDHLDDKERMKRRRGIQKTAARQRNEEHKLRESKHDRAAEKARALWSAAAPVMHCHGYIRAKKVSADGVRQLNKSVLVPIFNGEELVNIQFIDEQGGKRFLGGARKKGCYHPIGDFYCANEVLVCEGWATGRSLHVMTGLPVACAMDAGNLAPVAQRLRQMLPPDITITLAADDDRHRPDNPGIRYAKAAAWSVGGKMVRPDFCPLCDRCTDFNDVALCAARAGSAHGE